MLPRDLATRALAFSAVALLVLTAAAPVSAGTKRPRIAGCNVLPATNVWNRRVDKLPVHPDSGKIKRRIGLNAHLHPDFGSFSGYGIPWNVVDAETPRSDVGFWWPDESDVGPYPIPPDPLIEAASDRHILMLDRDRCKLFELFAADYSESEGWTAGSGAIWKLRSNKLRPKGWTSADAAGLPILPGLVRYKEIRNGAIRHALRFTAPNTRRKYIYPARHFASDERDRYLPPMGLRVRLKSSVDISKYPRQARVLLRALKRYGMILADNGSPWYITGAPDPRWNDDALHTLHGISGKDFEVVDTKRLRNGS